MRIRKVVPNDGAVFVVAAAVLFSGFARLVMAQVADVALDASGTWSFLEARYINTMALRNEKEERTESQVICYSTKKS